MTTNDKREGIRWRTLEEFAVPSASGNERQAMERVAAAVRALRLPPARLERLKTAVAEAVLNAIEHGHHYQADLPVQVRVSVSGAAHAVSVRITDSGGGELPVHQTPDLPAKLNGQQPPRGWGFFLIEKMVDQVCHSCDDAHHTIELFLYEENIEHRDEAA